MTKFCEHIEEPRRTEIINRMRDKVLLECKALRAARNVVRNELDYSVLNGMVHERRLKLAEIRRFANQ